MIAPRRRTRQREAQLAFEALSIEGGLLSPDWLSKAAQVGAGQQADADYRVPKGLNLRDEIGRYWRIAQAHWNDFAAGRRGGAKPQILAERFVGALLRDVFGFGSLQAVPPVVIADRAYPIGFCALGLRVPVVIAPAGDGVETLATAFGDEGRRRTAFGLSQEYLNAADGAMWGIATDGARLRILRDNASLTRPAWIEADLERIFTEERYADFAALWLLTHETRFGEADQPVAECALEQWRASGRDQGTRAREDLRRGVQDALLALGHGFVSQPGNQNLRAALQDGSLSTTAYFQQLLRLVYRLIFLLTVEERDLLHAADAHPPAKALYAAGYSLKRLRERSIRRSAHDRFCDLWDATKIVFCGVAAGEPRLALPALAGIFAKDECPDLDAAHLENRALLLAMFRLSWLREDGALARVNWRDMGPEELGSVYESLLELVPQISHGGRAFAFATGGETKGNARKTTGSYYTPDSLVQVLLDSALEPVVTATVAAHPTDAVAALLGLAIVDPACGSGHFLLAAARRLAAHVARLQANGTPSAAEYRHAVRQVVSRCIFGVDLNPMAVELCKVSLWMEAVEPGLPLGFLDSHIQHGNALLGTTPDLMANGIPDAAWEAIEGDDKKTAAALKKRNKAAAGGQRGLDLFTSPATVESSSIARDVAALDAESDADLGALSRKESQWVGLLGSEAFRHQKFVADAWCAAFVWPKQPGDIAGAAPTNDLWRQIRDGQGTVSALTVETTEDLAAQYRFLHWHLAFPQVFARGGFDVVLGNPPWERVKLQEQEFFASRSDEIAGAVNSAARKKLIAALPGTDPKLWSDWCAASREAEGQSHMARQSGRYPLCGKGDVNTYALFAEHNRALLGPKGRAGFIVPTGIATDDTTKEYFGGLVESRSLASFYSFENEEKIFPSVHNQFKFALLCLDNSGGSARSDLMFFARQASAIQDPDRHFSLSLADFVMLNPNTRTCPTFRSRRDADLNLAIYRRAGILWREGEVDVNPWDLRFTRMLDMANDSGLFRTRADLEASGHRQTGGRIEGKDGPLVPLIEAKMVHIFDHRFSTYENASQANLNKGTLPRLDDVAHSSPDRMGQPEYWVAENEVDDRLRDRWGYGWLLGWRDISRSVDERTVIASLIPRAAVGHTTPLIFSDAAPPLLAAVYANLCSFPLDYTARQKVGGTHLTYGYLKQFPILPPSTYAAPAPWSPTTTLCDWILPLVLELTYTAWDLAPFAHDVGYDGPPFRWDPARRFLLRAELDAAFFHLYGLNRDDTAYVMDTFPIVRKHDEKSHGDYRTKNTILEIHDALTAATRTATPYPSRLIPPPPTPAPPTPTPAAPPHDKKAPENQKNESPRQIHSQGFHQSAPIERTRPKGYGRPLCPRRANS